MIALDTDHLSILDHDSIEGFVLGSRLAARANEDAFVTIITYEEQMRDWLSYVAKATSAAQQTRAYEKLRQHVDTFRRIPLLDYDASAAHTFERLRQQRIRIGSMDLKIAAIAITNGALLLSRNLRDFQQVPGLQVEDWTA